MSKGILLFAFSGGFDYYSLASICAKRAKHFLNLPVSVVTDNKKILLDKDIDNIFDKIIEIDNEDHQSKIFYDGYSNSETFVWKNSNRFQAFELTPYEETLVIDIDYLVSSDFLLNSFKINKDFLIFKDAYDLSGWRKNTEFEFVNQWSIPFYWATVFYFKKTEYTKLLFALIAEIKENWDYYRLLYQIRESLFRNDFAFSIAIHILNGYDKSNFNNFLPGKLYYTLDKDILLEDNNSLLFLIQKENDAGNYIPMKINSLDVHVMNKKSILRLV